jgi:hypothetical protein
VAESVKLVPLLIFPTKVEVPGVKSVELLDTILNLELLPVQNPFLSLVHVDK